MTERGPTPTFEEIADRYRAEMEDPAFELLLQKVRSYAQQIDGKSISPRQARRIKDELNQLRDEIAGNSDDVTVRISGRARLLNDGDAAQLGADVLAPHLQGFHLDGNQIDADGTYYPLHRNLLSFDYVSVDPIGPFVNAEAPYRISFHMSARARDYDELADYDYYFENTPSPERTSDDAEDEEEDDYLDVLIHARDIDAIELNVTSLERIARDLRREFPAIADQINRLKAGVDESERINIAGESVFHFDWRGLGYTTVEERQEVLSAVGKLLVETLHLDTSLYLVSHEGLMYGVLADNERVAMVDATPRTTSGTIVACTLVDGDNDGEPNLTQDETDVRVMLRVSAPAHGFGRGDHLLLMPAASVLSVANTRNQQLPYELLQEMPARLESQNREDIILGARGEEEEEDDASDVVGSEKVQYSYNQLRACQEEFATFWHAVREMCESRRFPDVKSAIAARDEFALAINEFVERHRAALYAQVIVSGECLEYVDSKDAVHVYAEDQKVVIDMSEVEVRRGDPVLGRRGQFSGVRECTIVTDKDDNGTEFYRLEPYLFFYDNDATEHSFEHGSPDDAYLTPLLQLSSNARYTIALGREGTLHFTELLKDDEIFETLQAIKEVLPEPEQLLDQLTTLSDILNTEQDAQFIDIDPVALQTVVELTQVDQTIEPLTLKALNAILKDHKLMLSGAIYTVEGQRAKYADDEGNIFDLAESYGRFITILEDAPNQTGVGPTIVLSSMDTKALHYIPIANLERVRV